MNNKLTYFGSIAVVVLVLGLCFLMSTTIDRKLAVIIDGVELGHSASVTVGQNSSICFQTVPHDYLTITPEGDCFRWKVNSLYHDSLQYFKINNINPNNHPVADTKHIRIILNPNSNNQEARVDSFSGTDIWKTWEEFKDQKDVLLRNFVAKYKMMQESCSHEDSLYYFHQMRNFSIRSFLEKKDNRIVLVILDEYTILKDLDENIVHHYMREGITETTGEKKKHCKVQFFAVSDYCYKDKDLDPGTFQIDGVNYVMKTSVKLSEWGAGHVMIEQIDENRLRLSFPKPITFISSVDTLRSKAKDSSGLITLKQQNNSFPAKGDMYIPEFSNAANFDLCNIELNHQNDSIVIRDNNYNTKKVDNPHTAFIPVNIIPALSKMRMASGDDTLITRTGFVNHSFVLSYFFLPFLVCLVLILLIWLPGSPIKVPENVCCQLYNYYHIKNYPIYLTILLLISLAYCWNKSLIALKLSYTYPYFEKITGIIPVSTSMMILLFFTIAMLLNTQLLHITRSKLRLWSSWLVCVFLFGGLLGVFFMVLDPQVSKEMIRSYFNSEVYNIDPREWLKPNAIKDTHRSVVYALCFVESVALTIWGVFNFKWNKIQNWFQGIHNSYTERSNKINDYINRYKIIPNRQNRFTLLFVEIWNYILSIIAILFPIHLLLLIALVIIGLNFGNFGTAIITTCVILGLSRALSQIVNQIEDNMTVSRGILFSKMLVVTIIYILFAMGGDRGYMTNYLGFFLFLIASYFLVERPNDMFKEKAFEENKSEKKGTIFFSLVIACSIIFLPLICSIIYNPEKVDYSRTSRRLMLYSNFDNLQKSGYRYSESDAEFMVIMSHYMQKENATDPLSNDSHFMHASISTGQSPVVLNDLSLPVAFFGSYNIKVMGMKVSSIVFFSLLFILITLVLYYSIGHVDDYESRYTKSMQWRMLAMFMWVGTSMYIYLSYIDMLPFTGRLCPGFGVDAVGEVLETAVLLAFMASTTCKERSINL